MNQDIIKTNQIAKSLYDLKRPKIVKPFKVNATRTNASAFNENKIEEEDDWYWYYYNNINFK